jgi:hypothetical protein
MFTCPGFQFGASAGAAVFLDADGITPSDVVVLADVAGGSTITFVSDVDLNLTLPVGPITTVIEPQAFVTTAVSIAGGSQLQFTFTSDVAEGQDSEQIAISVPGGSEVPEPSTLALLGLGVLTVMAIQHKKQGRLERPPNM